MFPEVNGALGYAQLPDEDYPNDDAVARVKRTESGQQKSRGGQQAVSRRPYLAAELLHQFLGLGLPRVAYRFVAVAAEQLTRCIAISSLVSEHCEIQRLRWAQMFHDAGV